MCARWLGFGPRRSSAACLSRLPAHDSDLPGSQPSVTGLTTSVTGLMASARESHRIGGFPGFERFQRGPDGGPGRRRHRVQGLQAVARVNDDRLRAGVEHAVGEQPAQHPEGHPGCGLTKYPLGRGERSEEHTSELQSHVNLVCRLLLEKKKNMNV